MPYFLHFWGLYSSSKCWTPWIWECSLADVARLFDSLSLSVCMTWCDQHRGRPEVSIWCAVFIHPAELCRELQNLWASNLLSGFEVFFFSFFNLTSVCVCEAWNELSYLIAAAWWVSTCFISWGYVMMLHEFTNSAYMGYLCKHYRNLCCIVRIL